MTIAGWKLSYEVRPRFLFLSSFLYFLCSTYIYPATATVDQRARFLEAKVSENQEIIESLRNERESLVAEHDTLQRRYVEASAQVDRLRQKLSASQSSHDERRHQLDLRVNEIESLRREISEQARELEKMESEKNQARADQSGIVRSVTSLELDLKRVISDAEALGRDLKDLKTERDVSETRHRNELDKANRAQKQLCAQLRLANEQLEAQREKTKKALADRDNHVCQSCVFSYINVIQISDHGIEITGTSLSCVHSTRLSARVSWYSCAT